MRMVRNGILVVVGFMAMAQFGCAARISFLEIDKMTGASFPVSSVTSGGTTITMPSIFVEGGLILDRRDDDANRTPRSSWSDAELHNCMLAWKNPAYAPTSTKWQAYLLVTVGQSTTWGSGTLGVMFDDGSADTDGNPRDGAAVFWDAHAGMARHDEEIFLTAVHELNHVFNSHHGDWEGGSFFSSSTIEGYSFTDTVVWGISARTEDHLLNHPEDNVRPGAGATVLGSCTAAHIALHH